MSQSNQAVNIIRTKLYCPPVPSNYIDRDVLDARLEAGYQLPLNVLASPAGYGKSTLVSHWVQSNGYPYAWLSLDESDSDVRVFFNYFVAALRTVSAEAGEETLNTISAETLPPLSVIAGVLSNDLEDLEMRVIMVLDDYHRIREPAVHKVLDSLLAHPSRHLHLVVLSRRDPQLSLASLRAGHLCNEIRIRDLEFSSEETASYFERVVRRPVDRYIINQLQAITEGWVVGVRLASLALLHQDDIKGFLREFSVEARPLREYMLMEVLSKLPPGFRDCLLTTSILDRFNASLCDAVCSNEEDGDSVVSGKDFIDGAESTGLFCIALDGSRKWFRFHHLFSDLLKQQLIENQSRAGILQLHKKASNWFEQNGYYQEAIQHSLAADDVKGAAGILDNARHGLMNRDLWYQLELWLKLFPHKAVEQLPHLLVLRCWLDLSHWYRLDALILDVEKAGALLENADVESKEVAALKAELSVIRSALAYWTIDSELAASLTDKALGDIPEQQEYVRSVALMYRAGAYQLDGETQQAELLLRNHYNDERCNSPGSQARIMQALCFLYWSDADTRKLRHAAKRLLQISLENDLLWSHSFARYFLGLAHYECNELSEAIEQLEIITIEPYSYPIQNVMHCSFLLGLCYQAQVLSHRAREIADSIAQFTLECGNKMFIDLAEAFQAELDLLQGNSAQADIWVENFRIPPAHVMHRFFNAELTFARLIMVRDPKAAAELLDDLQEVLVRSHHRRLLIDVLGLKAVIAEANEDTDTASELLQEAVRIGQPGQLIRPLANLGSGITTLLDHLELGREGRQYVDKILSVLTESDRLAADSTAFPASVEMLSRRELQVLELFARNLSNKEIAHRLCISFGTVKRHAHNIYGKLDVSNRHKAVAKATSLGLLQKATDPAP